MKRKRATTQARRSTRAPRRLSWTSVLLTPVVGLVAAPSFAQDDSELSLEEVVVTAQRRDQNLQDVPIALSAFTADSIEKFRFDDVGDYVTQVPNASFISNGARSRRQISIRGVTNFLGFVGTSTTGFYIDDFSIAGSTINPPIMDIERIEILRGPQATYFGRNALGGGISITSKKPTDEFEGSLMADLSSFDTIDVEAVVNIPISDTISTRFNAKSITSDGNIENINPVGGGNDSDYEYIKGAVRFTPSENLTIDASYLYAGESVGMREGVPSGVFSNFAGNVLYSGQFPDRDGDGASDPFVDEVGFFPGNRDRTNFNADQKVGTTVRNAVFRVDYTRNDLLFTSITGFVDSDFFLNGDIDGSSRDFFNEFRNLERESISTEFRVQNTNPNRLQWNLGFLYAEDDGKDTNRTFVGAEQVFGLPEFFLIDREDSTSASDTWAIFGQLDYDVTDRLTVSVGGRYSEETKRSDISGFSGGFQQTLSVEDTFDDFSPRLAATYQASDDMTFYATISKGFKSGGVQIAPNPDAETFDPEELWNYEIGMKADFFDSRLRLNAAAFVMDWEDLQVSFQENLIDDNGDFILFGGVNNAESATSRGVAITTTAILSDSLLVNVNLGYLDAEFDSFTALIDGANRVLDGRVIPNSPELTASADAEYNFDYNAEWSGFGRLEWVYRDEIKPNTTSLIYEGFPWDVPSYDYFNLRVGAERGNIRIVAYAENLFDSNFYTNAYQKAFAGGLFIEPSFRRVGLRATYSF
ncbi:MAG: TonB-dependent receptor [Pseudomonadota bacterium]